MLAKLGMPAGGGKHGNFSKMFDHPFKLTIPTELKHPANIF